MNSTVKEIVEKLDLMPHPEGGHYRRTHTIHNEDDDRGTMSSILYLLPGGIVSSWHMVDADEVWVWNAGSPLELAIRNEPGDANTVRALGPDILNGDSSQALVNAGQWQCARSKGDWSLVSCFASPEFLFTGFELTGGSWDDGPRRK